MAVSDDKRTWSAWSGQPEAGHEGWPDVLEIHLNTEDTEVVSTQCKGQLRVLTLLSVLTDQMDFTFCS
jgi:hypothetical protein